MTFRPHKSELAASAVLAVGLAWSMASLLRSASDRWASDARYSHGYLVPLFALVLLYIRRGKLRAEPATPRFKLGLLVIVLGAGFQALGGYVGSEWVATIAIIPYFCGLALIWGGVAALKWALPSILFLVFMIPLPWRLEVLLGPLLQQIATKVSTFGLQTLGMMAYAEGNIIRLGDFRIGVVDACSGLGMLMTFFAVSTGLALVLRDSVVGRVVLAAFAIPVAIMANAIRIMVTGVLFKWVGAERAEYFYHDLAGWLMIPLALVMLWGLRGIWTWVVDTPSPDEQLPLVVGLGGAGPLQYARERAGEGSARGSRVLNSG